MLLSKDHDYYKCGIPAQRMQWLKANYNYWLNNDIPLELVPMDKTDNVRSMNIYRSPK